MEGLEVEVVGVEVVEGVVWGRERAACGGGLKSKCDQSKSTSRQKLESHAWMTTWVALPVWGAGMKEE